MADTDSPTMRRRAWDWWTSVIQTRLEPTGAICLIQTRWHEDDLAGRILATERDAWRVIDLSAIADSPDDPLGHAPGEALWPERFDAARHAKTRKRVGERVWGALYMQKPRPPEGGVWQREWIDNARINAVQFTGLDMARIIVGVARNFDRKLYVLADRSGSMGANDWGVTALPPGPGAQGRRRRGGEELRRRHGETGGHPGRGATAQGLRHQGPAHADDPGGHREGR